MPDIDVEIPYNWTPRPYQLKLFGYLEHGGKRAIAVWPRRAGKDDLALHWACVAAHRRVATYWHLLPEATQARKAIWDAVNPHSGKRRIDEAFPLELRSSTREQEMMIKFKNGSTWQVVGSDNYNSLVGSPPAGVVYSEWALANPLSWGYIRPILAENGGWALFIYTPRGRNHGAELYEAGLKNPEWFVQKMTAEETGHISKERLDKELQEYIAENGPEMGKALFNQEFYCSFDAANIGAVYADWVNTAENEGRLTAVAYDKNATVNTAWDLGFGDTTCIWFYQLIHDEIHIIDCFESNGHDVKYYCDYLANKGYRYDKHYVPHDANHKLMAAGGRSIAQQALDYGVDMIVIPATSQANSIAATRKILGLCWFDEVKCEYGLKALRNYRFKFDNNTRVFSDVPLHDWSSNYSDAFEIIGLTNVDTVYPKKKEEPKFLHQLTANDVFFPPEPTVKYRERI